MSTIEDFETAIQDLDKPTEEPDMSNMDNWVCVHATNYMPRRNENGELYIPTTGMATDYEYARATVHFTLNQIVSSHMSGNWDESKFVILIPYNKLVELNGKPRMVASADTYFIPNPDVGLVLPQGTHIVCPNNDTLFSIGDGISTYKTSDFTNEEIELILSYVGPALREDYIKYKNAAMPEYEIKDMLQNESDLMQDLYKHANSQKEKDTILRIICEKRINTLLTTSLREIVVRMTMKKMGYEYVSSHEDENSNKVADAARAKGIDAHCGDKVHWETLEYQFEQRGIEWLNIIRLCETNDIEKIYEFCCASTTNLLVNLILGKEHINVYQSYQDLFKKFIKDIRLRAQIDLKTAQEYPDWDDSFKKKQEAMELSKYADELEQGGIKAYKSPYLDVVLHRNAARLEQDFAKALEKLKQNPEYPILVRMLNDLVNDGPRWCKTEDGWQTEDEFLNMDIDENFDPGDVDIDIDWDKLLNDSGHRM